MSETIIYQGEERYVQLYKWNSKLRRVLVTSLRKLESIYEVRYEGKLNGHIIIDERILKIDNPYHVLEPLNGYKNQ